MMEDEIQEKLEEIYKKEYSNINVKSTGVSNIFEITYILNLCLGNVSKELTVIFPYMYERFITLEANIQNICDKLDKEIILNLKEKRK